jgi:hypothetical protein
MGVDITGATTPNDRQNGIEAEQSRRRSWLNLAVMIALMCIAVVYALAAIRGFVAQRWADSFSVTNLQRAARLTPGNAEIIHVLGLQLSTSPQNYQRAMEELRLATQLDPDVGDYWLDLASVSDLAGQPSERDRALEAALNAEPNNPDIAAEAANYYLASGNTARALPLLRRALEHDPAAAEPLLPVFWRATQDAKLLLDQGIPDNPELQVKFLRLLVDQKDSAGAADAWRRAVSSGQTFPPDSSYFYFDYLIREHDVAALSADWADLARIAPSMQIYLPSENLVVDGGFEKPVIGAGLDWRVQRLPHITSGIDSMTSHTGGHSLILAFDGTGIEDSGWQEFVPVQPGGDYKLSAWIKCQDIISSSGPRFAVVDAYSGANLLMTDDVLDTHPWQQLAGELHVPQDTNLVSIKIIRAPGYVGISGKVWIDDISLEKK